MAAHSPVDLTGFRATPAMARPRHMFVLNIAALLAAHPKVDLKAITSRGEAGRKSAVLSFSAMNELIFLVDEAPEGGFTARALGESIMTEADHLEGLHQQVRDAVHCHFDEGMAPKIIRLHFVREEVIAL